MHGHLYQKIFPFFFGFSGGGSSLKMWPFGKIYGHIVMCSDIIRAVFGHLRGASVVRASVRAYFVIIP